MHIIYHLSSMIYIPHTHTWYAARSIIILSLLIVVYFLQLLPPPIMSVRCSYVNDFMWNICLLCDYDIILSIIIVSTRMMCGTFPSILSWLIVVYYPSLILVCYDLIGLWLHCSCAVLFIFLQFGGSNHSAVGEIISCRHANIINELINEYLYIYPRRRGSMSQVGR